MKRNNIIDENELTEMLRTIKNAVENVFGPIVAKVDEEGICSHTGIGYNVFLTLVANICPKIIKQEVQGFEEKWE